MGAAPSDMSLMPVTPIDPAIKRAKARADYDSFLEAMGGEEEVTKAIETLGDSLDVLFHCNSSYPAKDKELNLS